ncbi:4a-hydroxytetrahydrobiopterin dehydratase [Malonomonas rubra]|uniref:4a-hydroxytetrahydrobiopterin dehydratase n=1 Tax=Malonomonas rubra TaxID=57040 RepID=UPI0026F30389|nr:4a-hydroxytetrahydrobiopterin dehydratase [Malonomonas rubra]
MNELQSQACEPCRKGAPLATDAEVEENLRQLPDWQVISVDGIQRLTRSYKFKTFRQALAFTNQVGELAETQQHHPAILTEWGKVTVSWWTHKIGGLHQNDFIMAAKTDLLVENV